MPAKSSKLRVERDLQQALRPYIILTALPMVLNMLENNAVRVALAERKGRTLGYYVEPQEPQTPASDTTSNRASNHFVDFKQMHTINLQIDLNPYALLFVFLHEWAHLMTQKQYGDTVPDHGKEWKENFRQIFAPFRRADIFPVDILTVIDEYFVKTSRYFETELEEACNRYGADRKAFARTYMRMLKKGTKLPAPYMGPEADALLQALKEKEEAEEEAAEELKLKKWAEEAARKRKEREEKEKRERKFTGRASLGSLEPGSRFRLNGSDYVLLSKTQGFGSAEGFQDKKPLRIHLMVQVEVPE